MNFKPKTEAELDAADMLPPGIYPFEVADAKDTRSKSGNDMITISLRVYAPDGSSRMITDYLLEAYLRKIHNFAKATSNLARYNAGTFSAEDCLCKSGFVKVKIEKGKENPNKPGEFYRDRNAVADYLNHGGLDDKGTAAQKAPPPEAPPAFATAGAPAAGNVDEDVPF